MFPRVPDIFLVAPSGVILFLYFSLRPDVDALTLGLVFGIWAISMAWDLYVTFANRSFITGCERSFVVTFCYRKFPRFGAGPVILTESLSVLFLPVCFVFGVDVGISMGIAWLFSILHIIAIYSNERFVAGNQL